MRESGVFSELELDFFRAGEAMEREHDRDAETPRPSRPETEPPVLEDDESDEPVQAD